MNVYDITFVIVMVVMMAVIAFGVANLVWNPPPPKRVETVRWANLDMTPENLTIPSNADIKDGDHILLKNGVFRFAPEPVLVTHVATTIFDEYSQTYYIAAGFDATYRAIDEDLVRTSSAKEEDFFRTDGWAARPVGPVGVASDGVAGADGEPGAPGPEGPPGPTGAQGAAGAQGAIGAEGPTGATGPQGESGANGVAGENGVIGPTGATGTTGPAGTSLVPGGASRSVQYKYSSSAMGGSSHWKVHTTSSTLTAGSGEELELVTAYLPEAEHTRNLAVRDRGHVVMLQPALSTAPCTVLQPIWGAPWWICQGADSFQIFGAATSTFQFTTPVTSPARSMTSTQLYHTCRMNQVSSTTETASSFFRRSLEDGWSHPMHNVLVGGPVGPNVRGGGFFMGYTTYNGFPATTTTALVTALNGSLTVFGMGWDASDTYVSMYYGTGGVITKANTTLAVPSGADNYLLFRLVIQTTSTGNHLVTIRMFSEPVAGTTTSVTDYATTRAQTIDRSSFPRIFGLRVPGSLTAINFVGFYHEGAQTTCTGVGLTTGEN